MLIIKWIRKEMSKIQDLRDKIHRLNGASFQFRDLKFKSGEIDHREYYRMRDLVDLLELTCEGVGRAAVYKATSSLKIRKLAEPIDPALVLEGWRDITPYYFKAPSKGEIFSVY